MNNSESFEEVKSRLDEIVEAVSDDNIALDDALKLYEEAVQLGLRASSLLEENLQANNERYDEGQASDQAEQDPSSDGDPIPDQADSAHQDVQAQDQEVPACVTDID